MPRRATRVPLDDTSDLLEELDRPATAEDIREVLRTPSMEGIARVLGVIPSNSWGQALEAITRNALNHSDEEATRVSRRSSRTQRIRREDIPNRPRTLPLVRVLQNQDVVVDEETHELVRADEPRAVSYETGDVQVQIRKMKGKIVICQKAMNGACPILIERADVNAWTSTETLLGMWCEHMVPHAHKNNLCDDPYDREDTIPSKYRRRVSCRGSQCNPMEPVPEHRRWIKKEKKRSSGPLPHHKRTLII